MQRCGSTGCGQEIAFKVLEGRRNGDRDRARDARSSRERLFSGRIDSRYCDQHTCSVFYKPEGCNYKKIDYDSVCMLHTQCIITGCTGGRIQYLGQSDDPDVAPRYLRLEFCTDHKCSFPSCGNSKATVRGNPGLYQHFCDHHRCLIDGCVRPKLEGRPFCGEHKCRIHNCQQITAENAHLCAAHIKCEVRSCNNRKYAKPNSEDYQRYCQPHVTCETVNCNALRDNDSDHCVKHTCLERDCGDSSGKNRFCENHRCIQEGCVHPRAWFDRKIRRELCALHTCRTYNCLEAVDDEMLFCEDHGCNSPNCKSEGAVDEKCPEHYKIQIEDATKSKMKKQTEDYTRQIREKDDMIRELQDQKLRQFEIRQTDRHRSVGA